MFNLGLTLTTYGTILTGLYYVVLFLYEKNSVKAV